MVKNIKFRKVHDDFLQTLADDVKEISTSTKLFVSADKSRNIYEMESNDYVKILKEKIKVKSKLSTKKQALLQRDSI